MFASKFKMERERGGYLQGNFNHFIIHKALAVALVLANLDLILRLKKFGLIFARIHSHRITPSYINFHLTSHLLTHALLKYFIADFQLTSTRLYYIASLLTTNQIHFIQHFTPPINLSYATHQSHCSIDDHLNIIPCIFSPRCPTHMH